MHSEHDNQDFAGMCCLHLQGRIVALQQINLSLSRFLTVAVVMMTVLRVMLLCSAVYRYKRLDRISINRFAPVMET
jgi:hypothetical protein